MIIDYFSYALLRHFFAISPLPSLRFSPLIDIRQYFRRQRRLLSLILIICCYADTLLSFAYADDISSYTMLSFTTMPRYFSVATHCLRQLFRCCGSSMLLIFIDIFRYDFRYAISLLDVTPLSCHIVSRHYIIWLSFSAASRHRAASCCLRYYYAGALPCSPPSGASADCHAAVLFRRCHITPPLSPPSLLPHADATYASHDIRATIIAGHCHCCLRCCRCRLLLLFRHVVTAIRCRFSAGAIFC